MYVPNFKLFTICFVAAVVVCCQQKNTKKSDTNVRAVTGEQIETITLLGDTLYTPPIIAGKSKDNFETALRDYEKYPDSTEALIWYGRRTAYLGHFQKSILIYSDGIQKFPTDPRLYRHRGHRYISTRQYDKAIADFEKASELVKNQPDQTEPDGLPNARNIPISTLKGNIWYHLGLAYYLKGDWENRT